MVLVMGALIVNAQRTPVKVSDLPKGVSDSINKEYPGFTIKESSKVVENNVTTYEVEISKGMTSKTLTFDNTGKSLHSKGSGLDKSDKSMDRSKSNSSYPTSPSSSPSTSPSSLPSSTPSTTPSSSPSTTPSSSPSSTPSSTTPPQK